MALLMRISVKNMVKLRGGQTRYLGPPKWLYYMGISLKNMVKLRGDRHTPKWLS